MLKIPPTPFIMKGHKNYSYPGTKGSRKERQNRNIAFLLRQAARNQESSNQKPRISNQITNYPITNLQHPVCTENMKPYEQTIKYLYDLQPIGIKFGLHNTLSLLNYFHNPHQKIRTIHVAGTNGKGSTCSMISSVLQAAGYRVGLYISPHLIDFTERISINGIPITQSEVVRLTTEIQQAIHDGDFSSGHPTFFEVVTVMAMAYFHEQQVDVAVMEVGMGGRLDATNVIQPLLGIITNIDLEHQQYLGNSLLEIAREKAGIIKKGMPVITGVQQPEVLQLLADICQERGATLIPVPAAPSPHFARPLSQNLRGGQSFEVAWPAVWSDASFGASFGADGADAC